MKPAGPLAASHFKFVGICLVAALTAAGLPVGAQHAAGPPVIDVVGVTPRQVAIAPDDVYDEVASGLDVVGVGNKVYLEAHTAEDGLTFSWSIVSRPAGSTAQLSATSGKLVTFRPDKVGAYVVRLTSTDGGGQALQPDERRILAANWAGAGLFDTHNPPAPRAPECGAGFCHGGNNAKPELNVAPEWIKSNHAQALQLRLKGERGAHYDVSCLPCHTVGWNQNAAAVNHGFDDVAFEIGYDVAQIPALVHAAAEQGLDNFPELPAALQDMSSIQCESCHGAGSQHPSRLGEEGKGIAGADLGYEQCAQCHDSATGFQQGFYQWSQSQHPITQEAGEGHVQDNATCLPCHTGEGFVQKMVNNETPALGQAFHGITCAACHDPHYSENPHQLRLTGDMTFPSGQQTSAVAGSMVGMGGLCMRCHNSRVSNLAGTVLGSSRGAHYGTQGDMLMGINGWDFGLPFNASSAHIRVVEDTCVACHMAEPTESGPGVITPPAVGAHSFAMRDTMGTADPADDTTNAVNACSGCHEALDTYDRRARGDYDGDGEREGIQSEVQGLLALLRPGLLEFPGVSEEGPFEKINIDAAGFNLLTNDQRAALYNYNFVVLDGSLGVHNTAYAVQLLQRAYFGVYGRPISNDYPAMALRGPVQQNSASGWADYR